MESISEPGVHSDLQKRMDGIRAIFKTFSHYGNHQQLIIIFDNLDWSKGIDLDLLIFLYEKFKNTNHISLVFSFDEETNKKQGAFTKFLKDNEDYGILNLVSLPDLVKTNGRKAGDISQAERDVLKVISLFKESVPAEYHGEIKCINNLGSANYELGNYSLALSEYRRGLALSQKIGLLDSSFLFLSNIPNTEKDLGEYESAYQSASKGLKLCDLTGTTVLKHTC